MAKIGEGDKRWIVEERTDGTNVGNWHWTEKDCLAWGKKRLKEMFLDAKVLESASCGADCQITEITKCDGDLLINNRKGKTIYIYDLDLKIKWKGCVRDGEGNVLQESTGLFHWPSISTEYDDDEHEIQVTCDKSTPKLKDIVRKKGATNMKSMLVKFLQEFKAISPTNSSALKETPQVVDEKLLETKQSFEKATVSAAKPAASVSAKTHKFSQKEEFRCAPSDLYECLTDSNRMSMFLGSPAVISAREVGGTLSLLDGSVNAEYTALEAGKHIAMKFRMRSWGEKVWSNVDIKLSTKDGQTVMKMDHTNIPDGDAAGNTNIDHQMQNLWKNQFWHRIRGVFGYGVSPGMSGGF